MKYKKGKENHHADALSRLLTGSPTEDDDNDEIPAFLVDKIDKVLYGIDEQYEHIECIEFDYAEVDHLLVT